MSRPMSADIVVIGSGAAGAVVAARCAEQGARVVLLEEGPHIGPTTYDAQVQPVIRDLYRDGGAVMAFGVPPMPVQVGRCVGGSAAINGGTCFRTPADVLDTWSQTTRGAFSPAELEPYFETIEADLNIAEVPPELAFVGERWLLDAAKARGDRGGFVKRNALACQGTGLCAFICPTGAKQSMERSHIPRFLAAGGTLLSGVRADLIDTQDRQVVGVTAVDIATGGEPLRIDAPVVALCAGALHSPLLLRRSLGWRTPRRTGRRLSLHPGVHVYGLLPDPVEPRRGPIQSVFIEAEGYVIYGMGYPVEVMGPMLMPAHGGFAGLADYPRTVTVAVMASDHDAWGRVGRWVDGRPAPFYQMTPETAGRLVRGTAHAAELLFDIGAVEVHHHVLGVAPFTRRQEAVSFARRSIPRRALFPGSVHPMGTCAMGLDSRTSVVDPFNRVHGIDGLYVPDASFFPSSIGVNPQVTINAFALRCADTMLEDAGVS